MLLFSTWYALLVGICPTHSQNGCVCKPSRITLNTNLCLHSCSSYHLTLVFWITSAAHFCSPRVCAFCCVSCFYTPSFFCACVLEGYGLIKSFLIHVHFKDIKVREQSGSKSTICPNTEGLSLH